MTHTVPGEALSVCLNAKSSTGRRLPRKPPYCKVFCLKGAKIPSVKRHAYKCDAIRREQAPR